MKIKINNIESFRSPENITYNVNDSIERIALINGHCVQDYGYISTGDSFTIQAVFSKSDFDDIVNLWLNRQKITFTDDSGTVWQNMRIVIKSYQTVNKFTNYINLNFELWRI